MEIKVSESSGIITATVRQDQAERIIQYVIAGLVLRLITVIFTTGKDNA